MGHVMALISMHPFFTGFRNPSEILKAKVVQLLRQMHCSRQQTASWFTQIMATHNPVTPIADLRYSLLQHKGNKNIIGVDHSDRLGHL